MGSLQRLHRDYVLHSNPAFLGFLIPPMSDALRLRRFIIRGTLQLKGLGGTPKRTTVPSRFIGSKICNIVRAETESIIVSNLFSSAAKLSRPCQSKVMGTDV